MITINGKTLTLSAPKTIGSYLDENNYRRTYIAVEKNGEILPKSKYDTTYLNDGDKIEIVSFVGGG